MTTFQSILLLIVLLLAYYFLVMRPTAKKQYKLVNTFKVGDEKYYDGRKCKIVRIDDDGCPVIEMRANKLKFDTKYNWNWR